MNDKWERSEPISCRAWHSQTGHMHTRSLKWWKSALDQNWHNARNTLMGQNGHFCLLWLARHAHTYVQFSVYIHELKLLAMYITDTRSEHRSNVYYRSMFTCMYVDIQHTHLQSCSCTYICMYSTESPSSGDSLSLVHIIQFNTWVGNHVHTAVHFNAHSIVISDSAGQCCSVNARLRVHCWTTARIQTVRTIAACDLYWYIFPHHSQRWLVRASQWCCSCVLRRTLFHIRSMRCAAAYTSSPHNWRTKIAKRPRGQYPFRFPLLAFSSCPFPNTCDEIAHSCFPLIRRYWCLAGQVWHWQGAVIEPAITYHADVLFALYIQVLKIWPQMKRCRVLNQ